MKRVLVTGGSGFVGRHCVPALVERGWEVHAVWRSRRPAPPNGAIWHSVDLLSSREVKELVRDTQPTHCLHLAWDARPGRFWTSPENLGWVQASLELVQALARHGCRRAVFAGTCAEYDWGHGYCCETTTPLMPATLYGACKHGLRLMVEAHSALVGLSTAWCRLFLLYGPEEAPQRFVPSVIQALLRGEPARCTHGRQVRDFLHVEDVASALVAVLESDVRGAINIGSGVAVTLGWVASQIAQLLQCPHLLHLGALAPPAGDPPLLLPVVDRLTHQVGWSPRIELLDGLRETISWWRRSAAARAA
jgi:nucleoside-diphosphate-sugar epimerase